MIDAGVRPRTVAIPVGAAALLCALLLAVPGRTVTTAYVNDLFVFLDGAHRIVSGQVPNRDFHTALGPLVYYIPAAGLALTGRLGAAMPVGVALTVLALAPALAHILSSRLRPALALPFGAFLLLVVAVPMNLGEGISSLSFGMFYNRSGWAALAALLVLFLDPAGAASPRRDAAAAAFLVGVMLYLKITYGVVGLAFLAFMMLDKGARRWATPALALTLAAVLAVEALWRGSAAHVVDLLQAGAVSGGLRGLEAVVVTALGHLADYSLFGLLAGLALWRRPSLRGFLFYGFCAGAGLVLIVQNSQPWGILSLHAGAVVAAETLLRGPDGEVGGRPRAAAPLLALVLVLPTIVHCALALGLHAALATRGAGEPFGLSRAEDLRLVKLWSPFDYDFSARYLDSLREGAALLAGLGPQAGPVVVLDFVNPFSAGLGLAPPRGGVSWLHWGRNVNATHFPPPEELFRDAQIVMEPKWGINAAPLRDLYGAYVAAHFMPIADTSGWRLHRARPSPEDARPGLARGQADSARTAARAH